MTRNLSFSFLAVLVALYFVSYLIPGTHVTTSMTDALVTCSTGLSDKVQAELRTKGRVQDVLKGSCYDNTSRAK